MELQLSYFKSCAALNMPANLENSAVATGLEKVSFHSNPKEGQCQRIFNVPAKLLQSCPTLCDPMDCNLSGSSVHGIFQAIVLEWIAISFSSGSSRPRGSNPGLPHCRQPLYRLSHQGSPNPKERQCQRMFKLPYNYAHFTC